MYSLGVIICGPDRCRDVERLATVGFSRLLLRLRPGSRLLLRFCDLGAVTGLDRDRDRDRERDRDLERDTALRILDMFYL